MVITVKTLELLPTSCTMTASVMQVTLVASQRGATQTVGLLPGTLPQVA
jgi:hypothetical protein